MLLQIVVWIFVGLLLLQLQFGSGIQVPCTYNWKCDYWVTGEACPSDYSPWDCFNYYYTLDCPDNDPRCFNIPDYYYDDEVHFAYCKEEGITCPRWECNTVIDPYYGAVQYDWLYNQCFCKFLQNREITMLVNNGYNNHTLSYHINNYTEINGYPKAIAYVLPTIDCIDRDIPYNLTIYNLCHDCTYSNTGVYGYDIVLDGPDGLQQKRSVTDLNTIQRPQRWENYTKCISETYQLEKSDWYGNGTLQITQPGSYQFTITMTNPPNVFRYNFTVNNYCTDGTPKPKPVPTSKPTLPPNAIVPVYLTNISNLVGIYQPLRHDTSWNELYRFSDSYYRVPCIRRNETVTIKVFPDTKLPYGLPTSINFVLHTPNVANGTSVIGTTNYTRTELQKPYLLYGDYYGTDSKKWYGRTWYRTGNYTLVITTTYKDRIHIIDTKTIDVKRNSINCSLNPNVNIFYP